jgi:hypothetical protein
VEKIKKSRDFGKSWIWKKSGNFGRGSLELEFWKEEDNIFEIGRKNF